MTPASAKAFCISFSQAFRDRQTVSRSGRLRTFFWYHFFQTGSAHHQMLRPADGPPGPQPGALFPVGFVRPGDILGGLPDVLCQELQKDLGILCLPLWGRRRRRRREEDCGEGLLPGRGFLRGEETVAPQHAEESDQCGDVYGGTELVRMRYHRDVLLVRRQKAAADLRLDGSDGQPILLPEVQDQGNPPPRGSARPQ